MSVKNKLLIVGAFSKKNNIHGGVVTDSKELINSDLASEWELILVDTTQIHIPPPNVFVRFFFSLKRLINVLYILVFTRPNVIFLFASPGLSILEKSFFAFIAKIFNVPSVLYPVGTSGMTIPFNNYTKFRKIITYYLINSNKIILCQGESLKSFFKVNLSINESKLRIINGWTATEDLTLIGSLRTVDFNERKIKLLFLGWVTREKGIFDLLNAIKILSNKFDFSLKIAGNGKDKILAEQYVINNQLSHIVRFEGWVDGEQKNKLLKESDILVLPSWEEGFPNVIIEALSSKLVVVATSVGNIPDILTNNVDSILIPPKNPQELYKVLIHLFQNTNLIEKISENGFALVLDKFSKKNNINKLIDLLNQLC